MRTRLTSPATSRERVPPPGWLYETVDEFPRGQEGFVLRARMRAFDLIEARLPRAGVEVTALPLRLEVLDPGPADAVPTTFGAWPDAADLVLVGSLDLGCARSGNRHLPREVAEGTGCGYAFAAARLALPRASRSILEEGHVPDLFGLSGPTVLFRSPATALAALPLEPARNLRVDGGRELVRPVALFARFEQLAGAWACVLARFPPSAPARAPALERLFEAACGYAGGDPLLVAISGAGEDPVPELVARRSGFRLAGYAAAWGDGVRPVVFLRGLRATVNDAGRGVSRRRCPLSDRCALSLELEPD